MWILVPQLVKIFFLFFNETWLDWHVAEGGRYREDRERMMYG